MTRDAVRPFRSILMYQFLLRVSQARREAVIATLERNKNAFCSKLSAIDAPGSKHHKGIRHLFVIEVRADRSFLRPSQGVTVESRTV